MLMIRLMLLAAAAVAAAGPIAAMAADGPKVPASMDAAFDNTIVSTYPDGRQSEIWLNRDGSYKGMGRRKDRSDGHWTLKGSKICLRQSHPMAIPFTYCTALHSGGVGTTWTAKAVTGEQVHVKLVAGRAGE
jgi:hypothetical protein